MDQDPELETELFERETSEDLERSHEKNKHSHSHKSPDNSKFRWRPLFLAGLGIFVLIIALALLFMDWNKKSREDLNSIKVRLEEMERQLVQLESMDEKIDRLNGVVVTNIRDLKNHIEKSNNWHVYMGELLNKQVKRIDSLEKRPAPAAIKTKAPRAVIGEPAHKIKDRYHEVRSGETLYKIAKKYGMSVDELCRLNNISSNQTILPGQKLLVSSETNQ
jgi:LysM repeat protein